MHMGQDDSLFFTDKFQWPRQFEIHLPGNHIKGCNLACTHCEGKLLDHPLGTWEVTGLDLLNNLRGDIPFHIYGGVYTEPTINPYLLSYVATTKKYGNHFGIHTNGTMLQVLEGSVGFLTELNRLSSDAEDYLSVSVYGYIPKGVETAVRIREKAGQGHSIRLSYLLTSETEDDIRGLIRTAQSMGVDSIRFSIPYAFYGQSVDKVKTYERDVEQPAKDKWLKILGKYLSKVETEVPYVFFIEPEPSDISSLRCAYGHYQIALGADGYIYKCSAVASPTMKHCRLGYITPDVKEFSKMIKSNINPLWKCGECFSKGVWCNRIALEINKQYAKENT